MQHGIGRAAHGHDHADGVLKRLAGEQVERSDVGLHRLQQHLGRSRCTVGLFLILRRHGGAVGQAQSHRFDGGAHRVGGEHAAAAARTRTGVLFNSGQLLFIDVAVGELTDGLEGAHHGEVTTTEFARLDRAAVNEDRRNVHPGHGEHRPRHVLVAATDGQHPIHALAVAGGLDRIGDHLTAHQGVLHPFGAHRNTVADGDGSEHLRHAPRVTGSGLSPFGEIVETDVARGDRAVTVGDAQDGFTEVSITKADGPQHGAVR